MRQITGRLGPMVWASLSIAGMVLVSFGYGVGLQLVTQGS